MVKKSPKE